MENIGTVKEMIRQDCFMASIDLTDAYHSVPIAKVHQKYLKISWKGQLYQYCSLALGLSSAPRIITKLLKPVLAKLRGDGFQSVAYLDDLYLQGKSRIECLKNVEATYDLLQKVGFHINEKKISLSTDSADRVFGLLARFCKPDCHTPTREEKLGGRGLH